MKKKIHTCWTTGQDWSLYEISEKDDVLLKIKKYILRLTDPSNTSRFSITSLKIIFKWSLPLTSITFFTSSSFFNASDVVIFLFSSSSVTISGSTLEWLVSSAAALLVSTLSAILLLWVSCHHSTISGSIAGKDIITSMSKSMYLSMSVLEKWWSNNSHNSTSICINLIILFKKKESHPKSTRIPLHIFKTHESTKKKKKSQEEEIAVKKINVAFATPISMLSQGSSILRLA